MKPPLYVRPITDDEREALKAGLRSTDAFTLRSSQILLASARGRRPQQIADELGCVSQTVRNPITAVNGRGPAALQERSHRNHTSFDGAGVEQLRALAHRTPREFGYSTSLWTLELLADESLRQGLTTHRVSDETIRQAILQLGTSWKRVKHWITSPDPENLRKKATRLADPRLAARGTTGPVVIWDNASWHISTAITGSIRAHNRQVKREGHGVRIITCRLPVKAPWLNPIEPPWVHGKRAVVEPARLLSVAELEERICTYFGIHLQDHLIAQPAA